MTLTDVLAALLPAQHSRSWNHRATAGLAVLLGVLCCTPTLVQAAEAEEVRPLKFQRIQPIRVPKTILPVRTVLTRNADLISSDSYKRHPIR